MPNAFPPRIFDRTRLRAHRDRAQLGAHGFLFERAAEEIADRLSLLRCVPKCALDLGAHSGQVAWALPQVPLVQMDVSARLLAQAQGLRVQADEEFLPFKAHSFDAALSALSLHWVNDLPGALKQLHQTLMPQSPFIAVLFGTQTLHELRAAFEQAELEISGGVSPRISPFVDVRDMASLAARAGFCEPVADSQLVEVRYAHPLALMQELRGMGESSVLVEGAKTLMPRKLLQRALALYPREGDEIIATFELVSVTAWSS